MVPVGPESRFSRSLIFDTLRICALYFLHLLLYEITLAHNNMRVNFHQVGRELVPS